MVEEDGTIHVPAFDLPLSAALTPETKRVMAGILSEKHVIPPMATDFKTEAEFRQAVDAFRVTADKQMIPWSQELMTRYPVRIAQDRVGGVAVEEFSPANDVDAERVLINLHGGDFCAGAIYVGRIESIPMAYLGKFRIISVDYRQGYENKFPAASEDVASVYAELIKEYSPRQIGIYGASAGGTLAAQAVAWFLAHDLPVPGAIGIFSAGAPASGDSAYFGAIGIGRVPPDDEMTLSRPVSVGYFSSAKLDDYLVNPTFAPESLRAKFPPTLLITATRAFDMSPAIATHRALAQAGVDASLHVFDGLWHCFHYNAATPESLDAYNTAIRFFRSRLGL